MITKGRSIGRLMPERIRKRRETMGLSGADLARSTGVTPAYVSQIENGKRVPEVEVAVALARALEDDEALYAAWSRDSRAGDPGRSGDAGQEGAWTTVYRSSRFADDDEFRTVVRSGRDVPPASGRPVEVQPPMAKAAAPVARARLFDSGEEPAGSVHRVLEAEPKAAAVEERKLVTAPVLAAGVDPGEEDEVPRRLWIDRMVLDPRFLPEARLGRPFVFRADSDVARRVTDRVAPDDLVIVSRDLEPGELRSEQVYALRSMVEGRIALGRVARVGDRFLVLPAPGRTEMEDIGIVAGRPPGPQVAGEVVAVLKVRPR